MFNAIRALFARRRAEEEGEQVAEQERTQRAQFEAWEEARAGAEDVAESAARTLRRRRALQEENASYRPRAR